MNVPPSSHFIYIPVILVLGLVLGFILGAKATRDAVALEQRRAADRQARRAARAAEAPVVTSATSSPAASAPKDEGTTADGGAAKGKGQGKSTRSG